MDRDLTHAEFQQFHDLIYRIAGIHYPQVKLELLSNRIRRRLKATSAPSFEAYLRLIDGPGGAGGERQAFLDSITTNETYFFRCQRHWDHFREWVTKRRSDPALKREGLSIWSAAASNGAEACTILIVLDQVLGKGAGLARPNQRFGGIRVEILGTDLSTQVLAEAQQARFRPYALAQTPPAIVSDYFERTANEEFVFDRELLRHVTFRQHNLMQPLAERRTFDVVFLRNVMIYFDGDSREKVLQHAFDVTRPGGLLFVGESESLLSVKHPFTYVRPSIFSKPEATPARRA